MIARVEGVLITFYVKPLEFQSLRMSKSQPRQFPIFAWEASPRIQIQGAPTGHGLHIVDIELTSILQVLVVILVEIDNYQPPESE